MAVTVVGYLVMSVFGVTWGLPSRANDSLLFGSEEPWSGEKILSLANAEGRFDARRGADVDVDPLDRDGTVRLTGSDELAARIYLRYRLYTHQPDEMITMMALAGMNPSQWRFDPRLYQYGGLFIYPVGALLYVADAVGWIQLKSDVAFYLDNPDEFGKFYVVGRLWSASWGLLGALVVFATGRRLGGPMCGLLSTILFVAMPVVVCMAHEAKPHLPGAVLMLMAVYLAIRSASPNYETVQQASGSLRSRSASFYLMSVCIGAAVGTVLSSMPVAVLLPWAAWRQSRENESCGNRLAVALMLKGLLIAGGVYVASNPYVLINAFANPDVLRSNFGNSLAMYEISRLHVGLLRVLQLTSEGATLPVLVLGVLGFVAAWMERRRDILPLLLPTACVFAQFVLIGADKPAEYGRFGVFVNSALAVGTGFLLTGWGNKRYAPIRFAASSLVVLWTAVQGAQYLANFASDASDSNTRTHLATWVSEAASQHNVAFSVAADPAPYCFPPARFDKLDIRLRAGGNETEEPLPGIVLLRLVPSDAPALGNATTAIPIDMPVADAPNTPISWANKPFQVTPIAARD